MIEDIAIAQKVLSQSAQNYQGCLLCLSSDFKKNVVVVSVMAKKMFFVFHDFLSPN